MGPKSGWALLQEDGGSILVLIQAGGSGVAMPGMERLHILTFSFFSSPSKHGKKKKEGSQQRQASVLFPPLHPCAPLLFLLYSFHSHPITRTHAVS